MTVPPPTPKAGHLEYVQDSDPGLRHQGPICLPLTGHVASPNNVGLNSPEPSLIPAITHSEGLPSPSVAVRAGLGAPTLPLAPWVIIRSATQFPRLCNGAKDNRTSREGWW